MELSLKLDAFEGPLDLLLHLIEVNKVNIYDIPIAKITDQYMEYIHAMQKADLNILSEFLVMAATLLDIKAKLLLPVEVNEEGEEEDPRAELVEQLLQYKMYKYMSYELKDRMVDAEKYLYKAQNLPDEVKAYRQPVDLDEVLGDLNLNALNEIFRQVLKRQEDKIDPIRSTFGRLEKEEVHLKDKLLYVYSYGKEHGRFSFRDLLNKQQSRMHTIVTFLSVLELMKAGVLLCEQENNFGDISLRYSADSSFDPEELDAEL